jgi:hypothetical protein
VAELGGVLVQHIYPRRHPQRRVVEQKGAGGSVDGTSGTTNGSTLGIRSPHGDPFN